MKAEKVEGGHFWLGGNVEEGGRGENSKEKWKREKWGKPFGDMGRGNWYIEIKSTRLQNK